MSHLIIPKNKELLSNIPEERIVWQPQAKQAQFMARPEYEVLYGGAAGGGKSDALLAEASRQIHIKTYRAIIFRKTFPQCSELIDRSMEIYRRAFPKARYDGNKHCWRFPSGAKIYFGSMQHKQDRTNYQGKRYAFIGFDELTHFTWDEYSYMFSRNRPGGPGERVYMRASCNPGGVGHAWVKERFIDGKIPLKSYIEEVEVQGMVLTRNRAFVPASVFDNKILLSNDPNYIANLALLPKAERDALLGGSWDSFSGQVFAEFVNDPDHYKDRRFTHVIEPFRIPKEWRRIRTFDFGYARPFSVAWWAVDYDGIMYRYRELYGSNGEPNKGLKWHPGRIAEEIRKIEDKYEQGSRIVGIADPSIWDSSRGESIATQMEKYRVFWDPGDNKRIPGKMQFHYRLAFDNEGVPMAYIFNNCKDFIRTVPNLVYDMNDVEDINSDGEDHPYDEARYGFMYNPIAPRKCAAVKIPEFDPLEQYKPKEVYSFMRA